MMPDILLHDKIPLIAETDILVIGAGSAGCLAALAAAYEKKYSVMLVERYGFAGGTSTQMLDTFYGFFTPGSTSKKIVGGIPDIVVNELDKTNDIFLRPNTYGAGTGVNYNPERLKFVWDQLILKAGVRYLLHTTLVDVVKKKMAEAFENKTHLLPRKEGSALEMCQPKCISTVAVKVTDLSALKIDELTKAEVEGRVQSFAYEKFFRDEVPGYEDSKIIGLSHQIGVRETRRVYGEHRLTKEECLEGEIPDSSILLCGAPIEDH